MLTQNEFIRTVRDELKLPLANPDLEHDFEQAVQWRSVQRVRLFATIEERTGLRVPVHRLFEEQTVGGIYRLYSDSAENPGQPR
jgi:acyl carrier protein